MIYLFIGPPGSGKGSLSKLCVDKLDWAQLSTGNLCREHIARQTEIGKQIDFAIKSGKLVSDKLIVDMVRDWLEQSFSQKGSVIFDGFPRTVPQAVALEGLLNRSFSSSKLKIIRFFLDDDVIVDRLTNRYICRNDACQAVYSLAEGSTLAPKKHMVCDECGGELIRRSDDTEASIRERLKTYHDHEHNLLDFYRNNGKKVLELSVAKPLDRVFEEFKVLVGLGSL